MLPFTGWGPIFFTMGGMSLISMFMLFFFSEVRENFVPFEEEGQDNYYR